MNEKYLEDFAVGQTYVSGRIKVDEDRIKAFAAEFDPQPFHMDEEAARGSIFGGLAASGWHTAALTCGSSSKASSNPPAASLVPASTNFAGRCLCDPGTSFISTSRCWTCGLRNRARLRA